MENLLINATDMISENNDHALILYGSPSSPCVRRCRITLLEKGLSWDNVNVDLSRMEQRSPEYLSINPNGVVPVLAHGERVIFESNVINEYLDNQFPEICLYPDNPIELAQVRMWQSAELAMAKIFRGVMYQQFGGLLKRITRTEEEAVQLARLSTDDPYDLAWEVKVWNLQVLTLDQVKNDRKRLLVWLESVEKALQGKEYLIGDQFSQADIAVFPRVEMYDYLALEIAEDRFPNVRRWITALEKRPSFVLSCNEAACKMTALVRSPIFAMVRKYFATDESLRSIEMGKKVEELGASLRAAQGVDQLLTGEKPTRDIPMPRKGRIRPEIHQRKNIQAHKPKNLTLYGDKLSPHSRRIELLLGFLGCSFEYKAIDLSCYENHLPDFLELNPLGEVPVVKMDELILYDSTTIAEHLCQMKGEVSTLFPHDSFRVAEHKMLLALEAGTHKEFTPLLLQKKFPHEKNIINAREVRFLLERIATKIDILNARLQKSSFLMGEMITYGDIAWFSRLEVMKETVAAHIVSEGSPLDKWMTRISKLIRSEQRGISC